MFANRTVVPKMPATIHLRKKKMVYIQRFHMWIYEIKGIKKKKKDNFLHL